MRIRWDAAEFSDESKGDLDPTIELSNSHKC
jgi:hypothetical protein